MVPNEDNRRTSLLPAPPLPLPPQQQHHHHRDGRSPSPDFAMTTAQFSFDDSELESATDASDLDYGDDDDDEDEGGDHDHDPELGRGGGGGPAGAGGSQSFEMRDLGSDEDEDEDGEKGGGRRQRQRQRQRARPGPAGAGTATKRRTRRHSDSTVASFQLYTPDEERAVVRKFDRRLVAFLGFCYMLSFLDRSNIGNARIAGMEEDLQTTPPRADYFEWALRSFYIAYIAFEWMSLLWRVVPAHVYVSLVVLSWGVVASLQAVAPSYPVLIGLRAVLGVGEAAFTGVPYFLSFFFRRRELAFRTAIFISAAPLASAFAGFLSWLIYLIGQSLPIASWRLLFLVEGFPSVIVATFAWNVIPDSPGTASYLTPRERKVARLRLRNETSPHEGRSPASLGTKAPASSALKLGDSIKVLADPKAWVTAFMFFLANMAFSSLPAFLPTILEDMGHSALEAEALSAPPNLIAFVLVLATAHASDRARRRAPFIVAHALVSAGGYAVLALARPLGIGPMVRYLAVYPAAIGFFSVVVLVIAWSVNNQADEGRRGGGFALLQVVGQCGPLLGAHLYPEGEAPFFEKGMWACAGAMAGVAILATCLAIYLGWLNRALDREAEGAGPGGEEVEEEEARGLVGGTSTGQKNSFRYML
ncbi:major facilitator superfamily transporter [Xylariaceae sp. FL0804]|nr:major facilitator superfamily transporter [Xylariaceae sp. FL0804]